MGTSGDALSAYLRTRDSKGFDGAKILFIFKIENMKRILCPSIPSNPFFQTSHNCFDTFALLFIELDKIVTIVRNLDILIFNLI